MVGAVLSSLLGRPQVLVWAPIRLLPLLVVAPYLFGSRPAGSDWVVGMGAAALTVAGGRWPLAVTLGQSVLLVAGLWIVGVPVAGPVLLVLAALALGELWMRRTGRPCWVGTAGYVAAQVAVNAPTYVPVASTFLIALATVPPILIGTYIRSVIGVAVAAHRQREAAVLQARAAERTAIARELHDLVAHSLSSIALGVGAARHALADADPAVAGALTQAHTTARTGLEDLRRLVGTLRDPARLDEEPGAALAEPGGLITVLAGTVERARNAGLQVDADIDPTVAALDSIRRLAVLRIVQEGLTNVLRHAGAQAHAALRVRVTAEEVRVQLTDDGGIRTGHTSRPDPGFGLVGMRERVELLGGHVSAAPRPPGWELTAVLPTATEPGACR